MVGTKLLKVLTARAAEKRRIRGLPFTTWKSLRVEMENLLERVQNHDENNVALHKAPALTDNLYQLGRKLETCRVPYPRTISWGAWRSARKEYIACREPETIEGLKRAKLFGKSQKGWSADP